MAGILYPNNGLDTFTVPSNPGATTLSSQGSSDRTHTQHHADLGAAVVALEATAAHLDHDHSGSATLFGTSKLLQENTHESPDTDLAQDSLHHTLGGGVYQAAAGNHAHDYMGPSIFNKPLVICTSLTRPESPIPGQIIVETDTNCVRMWSQFSGGSYGSLTGGGNTLNYGLSSTDSFARNDSLSLGSTLWSQTYYNSDGANPYTAVVSDTARLQLAGSLGTKGDVGEARWNTGTSNFANRCIARRVAAADAQTQTDDQVLTFVSGSKSMDLPAFWLKSPTNDAYLRMSADLQSYIRVKVDSTSVNLYYTTIGPGGETYLGGTRADTTGTATTWTVRAVGRTFVVYQGGIQLLAVTDSANVTALNAGCRGWGIGMNVQAGVGVNLGLGSQARPASLSSVTIADQPYYSKGLIWQLLPVGSTPVLRAEARFQQQVVVGAAGGVCGFDTIIEDWFHNPFMKVDVSQDQVTIQEAGHYDVHASICWDPDRTFCDHAMIAVTVNDLDIGRKNWEFVRGNTYNPGFSQTNEIYFHHYFAKGDILRVTARHNASRPSWLHYNGSSPDKQACWLEVVFKGP